MHFAELQPEKCTKTVDPKASPLRLGLASKISKTTPIPHNLRESVRTETRSPIFMNRLDEVSSNETNLVSRRANARFHIVALDEYADVIVSNSASRAGESSPSGL